MAPLVCQRHLTTSGVILSATMGLDSFVCGTRETFRMDEDRTTAIGLARYAREFFDAALAADDKLGTRTGYEVVAPVPVLFLVAHSIELILKSYLRHKGIPLRRIISLGHDLEVCWKSCCEYNVQTLVTLNEGDYSVLLLISELHKSTELRYIQTGFKTFPVFGPLESLARKLLDAICPEVGYARSI